MRLGESDLMQDLRIFDVRPEGADLHVDLYGGRTNVCGSVRFTFADGDDRRRNLSVLRAWQERDEMVSLLSYGDTITLLSERALLARGLQQA